MFRRLFLPLILVACIGVPYLMTHDDLGGQLKTMFRSKGGGNGGGGSGGGGSNTTAALPMEPTEGATGEQTITQVRAPAALVGTPVVEFAELFRFDINPNWVLSRWTRVSTATAGIDLEGLRVPVVTGVAHDDLAGSLTYYFDRERRLQRISFQGTTGDPARLATFVQQYYKLSPEESLDAGLYMKKWNSTPISALRFRLGTVVRADAPLSNYQVMLELNRPERGVRLSEPFMQSLEIDKRGQRW